jgi:hypothetical protein
MSIPVIRNVPAPNNPIIFQNMTYPFEFKRLRGLRAKVLVRIFNP